MGPSTTWARYNNARSFLKNQATIAVESNSGFTTHEAADGLPGKFGAPPHTETGILISANEGLYVCTGTQKCGINRQFSRYLRDPCRYQRYGRTQVGARLSSSRP